MPTVSKKQERFMQAVAHNPKFAKKVGVPTSVGKEFTKSGGGMKKSGNVKKMAMGGRSLPPPPPRRAPLPQAINKPGMGPRDIGTGGNPNLPRRTGKMAAGGMPPRDIGTGAGPRRPLAQAIDMPRPRSMPPRDIGTGGNPNPRRAPLPQAINKPGMMKKGGVVASKMGSVRTASPSRDGIASKGKTKGAMVKMGGVRAAVKGGKC